VDKLLRQLTAAEKGKVQLSILSQADERMALHVENKKVKKSEVVQKEMFPPARNFK